VATRKSTATLKGHTHPVWGPIVNSVAFSPDGKALASGSVDETIKLWDEATGKSTVWFQGLTYGVSSVAFRPDRKTLATIEWLDGTIKLWDVATGKNTATLKGHSRGVLSVAFSPDGKTLASGSDDDTIKLWDIPATDK
jgi:WD40 repeat protein